MRFAIASEGRTDYIVLKNLLIGFFKDKNLPITNLRPKDREPFGWGNLMKYISSQDFKDDCDDENIDYIIVQIDTNECEDWNCSIKHIGDNETTITAFIEQVAKVLADKIGEEYFDSIKDKILFAICVHEIECWLLPFNTDQKAKKAKLVGCANAIEQIAKKQGFSINEKNYQDGKHYETLSKEMKNNTTLLKNAPSNTGLNHFIQMFIARFPAPADE